MLDLPVSFRKDVLWPIKKHDLSPGRVVHSSVNVQSNHSDNFSIFQTFIALFETTFYDPLIGITCLLSGCQAPVTGAIAIQIRVTNQIFTAASLEQVSCRFVRLWAVDDRFHGFPRHFEIFQFCPHSKFRGEILEIFSKNSQIFALYLFGGCIRFL